MKTTEQLVFEMLTENTGTHFLDSGGADGRNWQRNEKLTLGYFRSLPEEILTVDNWTVDGEPRYYLERTVPLFQFLAGPGSNLSVDEIADEFNRINEGADNWHSDRFYGVSSEGEAFLTEKGFDAKEQAFNSYNGESDLSQVIQGEWLKLDGESYLLLQVHGGCDVRGGYTTARLFHCHEEWYINEYIQETEWDWYSRLRDYPESVYIQPSEQFPFDEFSDLPESVRESIIENA